MSCVSTVVVVVLPNLIFEVKFTSAPAPIAVDDDMKVLVGLVLVPKAVLFPAVVFKLSAKLPTAVLLLPVVFWSSTPRDPIPVLSVPVVVFVAASLPKKAFLKMGSILPDFKLLTRMLKGLLSVVPIKLVPSIVPALPVNDQSPPPLPPAVVSIIFPVASMLNVLPLLDAVVEELVSCVNFSPETFETLLFISKFVEGVVVPMPILPLVFILKRSVPFIIKENGTFLVPI